MRFFIHKFIISLLFIIPFNQSVIGQFKSHIQVVINNIHYENGLMNISYEIKNAKENDKIRVWVHVFNSKLDTIRANAWQGDMNKTIQGKGEKNATWDLFRDELNLIDSLSVKISATVENRFYLDDPIIASTVFPGLGDYQIKPPKPYWIYGAVGYSFLGASAGMYLNATKNYNNYLGATTIEDKNKYFKSAMLSKNLTYTFIGVAGMVWAMDYFGIFKRKKEIRQMWKKNLPIIENPSIPNFKIVSSISPKVFVNTLLTHLEVVEGSSNYKDLDENACLDAFEEGRIQFMLHNKGPAKAMNFYAKIISPEKNALIKYPDSISIGSIAINQSKLVEFPIKALKDIQKGNLKVTIKVYAKYNHPVSPVEVNISTNGFEYKPFINENDLISDVDFNVPVLPVYEKTRFALIIGNEGYANEYTGLSKNFNVPFARHDALAFKKYAINVLGVKESNIILLLDAKKNEISSNIHAISDKVKQLKHQAELIFYFAGHGLSDLESTAPYLMPVDIPPANVKNGISIDSLYKKITDSKSFRSLVVIDASFNNGGRVMGLRGPNAGKFQHRSEVIPSNTVVFSGVWKLSDIYFAPEKGHGLFTYAFLNVLKKTKGNINYLQFDSNINAEILSNIKRTNESRATETFFSKDISDIWQKWTFR